MSFEYVFIYWQQKASQQTKILDKRQLIIIQIQINKMR